MNNSRNIFVLFYECIKFFLVAQIKYLQVRPGPCYFVYTVYYVCFGIVKVINNDHFESLTDQFDGRMGTDITGSAGNQNFLHHLKAPVRIIFDLSAKYTFNIDYETVFI